jgi:polar amino acid transport system substrate-binding protein
MPAGAGLLILTLLLAPFGARADELVFGTAFGEPIAAQDGGGFFDRLIGLALGRLGHTLRIERPGAQRSLLAASQGLLDGDGPRICGVERAFPGLLRVDEPLMRVDFVAFTRRDDVHVQEWSGLAPYDVGLVRGWRIVEEGAIGTRSLTRVRTPELLFRLLANDRADVAVLSRLDGLAITRRLGLDDVRVIDPPLARREVCLLLNERHVALKAPLEGVLREMKSDGTYLQVGYEALGDEAAEVLLP